MQLSEYEPHTPGGEMIITDRDFDEILNLALMMRRRDEQVPPFEDLQRPDFIGNAGVSFGMVRLHDAEEVWTRSLRGVLDRSRLKLRLAGQSRTFALAWRTPAGSIVHVECQGAYTHLLALDYPIRAILFGRMLDLDVNGAPFPTNWLAFAQVLDKGPGVHFGLRET